MKQSEGYLREQKDTLFSTGDMDKTPDKRPRLDCLSQQGKGGPYCQRVYGKDLKSPSPDASSQTSIKRPEAHLKEQNETLLSTGDTEKTPDKRPRLYCLIQQGKRGPHCRRVYGKDVKSSSPDVCFLSSLKRSECLLMEQNDTLFSTLDMSEIRAKRPRVHDFIHQVKSGLYDASSLLGIPSQTTKPMVTYTGNGTQNVAPSGEVFSNSPFCELTGSGLGNMVKLGPKSPHEIRDYPNISVTVTQDQPHRVLPSSSFTLSSEGYTKRSDGHHHSKRNPESSFMGRPQEQVSTETVSEDSGKVQQRPHSTVEEVFQKEERKKYRNLQERRKSVSQGSSIPTVTSTHSNFPRSQMDILKTKGLGDESSNGLKTTQFRPRPYRIVETSGSVYKVKSEKRCSKRKFSGREKSTGVTLENESRMGHQLEPDLSEKLSPPLHLGDGSKGVLKRKLSICEKKEKRCSRKLTDKRMDDDLELTADMEKEIRNALGPGPQDQILSSAFKQCITRGDIWTLRNDHWLNDEVINFYMNLLMERNKKEDYPALYAFSTFFYPKLKSGGYQAVKKWTKGVNLFDQELILVPIHQEVHWSLVVIDIRKKCLKYLDSMGHKGHKICEMLLQYLQEESKTKINIDLNLLEWTHYSMKPHEIPQQLNGSDCGVFTCKFADYISREKSITFTQHQMSLFRKKMVLEILHQQLL